MQDGTIPAHLASLSGATGALALLLATKADINATNVVQQFKMLKSV
jgi:hypothetical protein